MLRERKSGRFCREIAAGDGMHEGKVRRNGCGADVTFCRTVARTGVTAAMPEIVGRFVDEAKKGSIAHIKALTAMGGMDAALSREEAAVTREGRPRQSLAGYLLKELKRQQRERGQTPEPKG